MTRVRVERRGGFAGFGLPGSHLRSVGEIETEGLGVADRSAVEALFKRRRTKTSPDEPVYRVTRTAADGREQAVEVPESAVPAVVRDCVHDELV